MSLPPEGVNVELSALSVLDSQWWTICFEAFGTTPKLEHNLLSVIQALLDDGIFFDLDHALDYPSWLIQLCA